MPQLSCNIYPDQFKFNWLVSYHMLTDHFCLMPSKWFKRPKRREEWCIIIMWLNWTSTITQQFPPNDILMPHCLLSLFLLKLGLCILDIHPNRAITVSSGWCIEDNAVLVGLTCLTLWWSEQESAGGRSEVPVRQHPQHFINQQWHLFQLVPPGPLRQCQWLFQDTAKSRGWI